MRADTLVFLHLLAAVSLFGGLLTVAVVARAGAAARGLVTFASVLVLAAAFATVALGEAARAREDAAGTWLDVGSVLGYAGLLIPGIALAVLARRARDGGRRGRRLASLATVMAAVAVAATFVMAAKPS